ATEIDTLKAWTDGTSNGGTFLTTGTTVYDAYGRPTNRADVDQIHTTTAYTPATGGPLTKTVVTNTTTTSATTTDYEPAWGPALDTTDPNSRRTDETYDPLGRLTGVWLPGHAKTSFPTTPSTSYAYSISATAPSVVTTQNLNANNTYTT